MYASMKADLHKVKTEQEQSGTQAIRVMVIVEVVNYDTCIGK